MKLRILIAAYVVSGVLAFGHCASHCDVPAHVAERGGDTLVRACDASFATLGGTADESQQQRAEDRFARIAGADNTKGQHMSEQDKVYANGVFVREHTFSSGKTILKVGIDVRKFVEFLNQHIDERGFVNIGISQRQKPSDKGITHTVWLDTWKPDQQRAARPAQRQEYPPIEKSKGDDIPF